MSDVKAAVVGGLIAVVSSALGSAGITYAGYLNSTMQVEQAKQEMLVSNSKVELERFLEKTAPVTLALNSFIEHNRARTFSSDSQRDKYEELSTAVSAMMPYVSSDLYFKADEASSALYEAVIQTPKDSKTASDTAKAAVIEFINSYYIERDKLFSKINGGSQETM